jgi:hypothetical protein
MYGVRGGSSASAAVPGPAPCMPIETCGAMRPVEAASRSGLPGRGSDERRGLLSSGAPRIPQLLFPSFTLFRSTSIAFSQIGSRVSNAVSGRSSRICGWMPRSSMGVPSGIRSTQRE